MKKLLLAVLSLSLFSCGGGGNASFPGVWHGAFTSLDNNCPFPVAPTLPGLFPMTVTEGDAGVFTVTAADGSIAVGGQGQGEEISFTATSLNFGDFGSIAPYSCTSTSQVGFLSTGDNKADINVTISFTNCISPATTDQISDCFASYNAPNAMQF